MVPFAVKANTTCHHNVTGSVGDRPLDATASLTVKPILPLPPHTFSCCIKREQLPKLSVAGPIATVRSTPRACGLRLAGQPCRNGVRFPCVLPLIFLFDRPRYTG